MKQGPLSQFWVVTLYYFKTTLQLKLSSGRYSMVEIETVSDLNINGTIGDFYFVSILFYVFQILCPEHTLFYDNKKTYQPNKIKQAKDLNKHRTQYPGIQYMKKCTTASDIRKMLCKVTILHTQPSGEMKKMENVKHWHGRRTNKTLTHCQ